MRLQVEKRSLAQLAAQAAKAGRACAQKTGSHLQVQRKAKIALRRNRERWGLSYKLAWERAFNAGGQAYFFEQEDV